MCGGVLSSFAGSSIHSLYKEQNISSLIFDNTHGTVQRVLKPNF